MCILMGIAATNNDSSSTLHYFIPSQHFIPTQYNRWNRINRGVLKKSSVSSDTNKYTSTFFLDFPMFLEGLFEKNLLKILKNMHNRT